MVILNNEQKEYIKKNCHHPLEVIYYIEKRCKSIHAKMSLEQMIEIAQEMIEEHSFWEEDFSSKNDN